MKLQDKRVLIVGGGSGIGYAVAEVCLEEGARVVVASSDQSRVQAAAERLGKGATASRLDITREQEVAAFFAEAEPFHHIVTTAGDWGSGWSTPLPKVELDAAKRGFEVRFWGALLLAKHGAAKLAAGGSLTLTDGMIAHKPMKGAAVASAMAGAIEHLTRSLAVELAPLRVNAVCPGLIRSGIWDRIPEDQRDAQLAAMTKHLLLPRVGTVQEAAEAYLYLLRGSYTTGQVLYVEGGAALTGRPS
ncbi:MAG TPA: SDR family oxidoreductase [Polyangiales bacterium]|nr:SDR family oxidoreductase [Polyangiales bacterium]